MGNKLLCLVIFILRINCINRHSRPTNLELILRMYSQEVNGTRAGLHCREMRLVPWRSWSGIDSRIQKGEDLVVVWWSRDPLCWEDLGRKS